MKQLSRREILTAGGLAACAGSSRPAVAAAPASPGFRFCLNTATLQGFKLDLLQVVEIAAKAGYHAIEPWLNLISAYVQGGGSLPEMRKRIAGAGLNVESAIAFATWMVDDPAKRAAGLEQAKREMEMVAQLGGKRIAAPPAGANTGAEIPLPRIAERYRALLELGDQMGVVPELEFWGSSVNLNRLDQAVFAAMQTGHPKACVLADVFHLYKGGSGFLTLRMLSAEAMPVLHMNDYPATPPRAAITDRDRVYPGDGVAPLNQILWDLHRTNPGLVLSLELFNPEYWKGDPLQTARTGLVKMQQAVRASTP